jgi:hypothetical protein
MYAFVVINLFNTFGIAVYGLYGTGFLTGNGHIYNGVVRAGFFTKSATHTF